MRFHIQILYNWHNNKHYSTGLIGVFMNFGTIMIFSWTIEYFTISIDFAPLLTVVIQMGTTPFFFSVNFSIRFTLRILLDYSSLNENIEDRKSNIARLL